MQERFKPFQLLNQWVEALDCLIFPEHRFRYWFQLVCDCYQDPAMKCFLLEATGHQQTITSQKNPLLEKIRKIILMMWNDIMTQNKPIVGS